jgi:hypothetical protein
MLIRVRDEKPKVSLRNTLSAPATSRIHFQLLRGVNKKVAAITPAAGQMAAMALRLRKVRRAAISRV